MSVTVNCRYSRPYRSVLWFIKHCIGVEYIFKTIKILCVNIIRILFHFFLINFYLVIFCFSPIYEAEENFNWNVVLFRTAIIIGRKNLKLINCLGKKDVRFAVCSRIRRASAQPRFLSQKLSSTLLKYASAGFEELCRFPHSHIGPRKRSEKLLKLKHKEKMLLGSYLPIAALIMAQVTPAKSQNDATGGGTVQGIHSNHSIFF